VAASASGRVAPPEGVDWAAGASGYLRRIGDVERHYLLTKPYYDIHEPPEGLLGDGVDGETARHLGDAAEIATLLALAPDSTVLDAACGSGWLTEHLARFGWQVTGADLSAELVELARSRLAAQPFAAAPGRPLRARFVVHDLTQGPLAQTFDAVVCYDALHHLADERAAVAHLAAMVAPGGLLLIVEGARPTPGSQGERELQDVMAKYQTLESPFDHNHLLALVEATGLTVIGDYLGPLGVYERGEVVGGRVPVAVREHHRLLSRRMLGPTTGTTANGADGLRAQWAVRATVPLEAAPGQAFSLPVAVTNAGARAWLADRPGRTGSVSVAATVDGVSQRWVALPRIVGPREQADLELEVVAPLTRGTHRITVDLVAHDVSWFGDAGSEVLSLPLRVR
jgi:SAM-dependent methyltransferase